MLLRYGLRALQIALGLACLAVLYTGLAPVLDAAALPAVELPPPKAPPERDGALDRYQVIATRNLFRAGVAAPETPLEEALKESELRLKLCGTYAASPAERSVACIEDLSVQKRRAYRVGQDITQGVKLVAVERRRAVIDNRGAKEQLTMEEPEVAGSPAPASRQRVSRVPRPALENPRLSDRLRELRERTPTPTPAESAEALKPKLQSALDGAQITPVYDDSGEFGGVRLTGIRPGGVFAGMPEQTVCYEVNGTRLAGVQTLAEAAANASSTGETCLRCRQPDGVETVRCL